MKYGIEGAAPGYKLQKTIAKTLPQEKRNEKYPIHPVENKIGKQARRKQARTKANAKAWGRSERGTRYEKSEVQWSSKRQTESKTSFNTVTSGD